RVHFPLGDLTKDQVRAHASRLGLAVWDKPESQDLCFAPAGDYAAMVTKQPGAAPEPGPTVKADGQPRGTQRGLHPYTGTPRARPQMAITPGQSCVLYDGDRVLGGAPIARSLP